MNYWTILISAVVAMIIGYIWYGPLFKKAWCKTMGMDTNMSPEAMAKMKKGMGGMMVVQFILCIISVWVLAKMGASVSTALWVWFGFVMPAEASAALWSGKSKKQAWNMFLISAGCGLVTFLAYGYILGM